MEHPAVWEYRSMLKQAKLIIEPDGSVRIVLNEAEIVKFPHPIIVWLWDTLIPLIAEGKVTKSAGKFGSQRRIYEAKAAYIETCKGKGG